jgi:hypothetical protein
VEKITTIGDAYMVAGGIPQHRADHAEAIAEMASGIAMSSARDNNAGRPPHPQWVPGER